MDNQSNNTERGKLDSAKATGSAPDNSGDISKRTQTASAEPAASVPPPQPQTPVAVPPVIAQEAFKVPRGKPSAKQVGNRRDLTDQEIPPTAALNSPSSLAVSEAASSDLSGKLFGWLGRSASSKKFLLTTLLVFVALWLMLFVSLYVQLFDFEKAGFIAYVVATGGDPFNFRDLSEQRFIWIVITILHVFSWLIVPVLIATIIDAAYRVYEERGLRARRIVRKQLLEIGMEYAGLSGEELNKFVEEQYNKFIDEEYYKIN
jgi:hypothetical protein